ncbi:MAG: FtsQ-type POTRA domain-containing protein [Lachnospiraceae bacterium]|nr:FtsQ-type POTRA domain-containing protein [Lachnospiraceae bacterium]
MDYFRNHKSIFIISGLLSVFTIALFIAIVYVLVNYKVNTVYVEGNVHYSNEEIMGMVMDGPLNDNSIVLSIKYRNKKIKDIPFISTMDVSVLDPNTVKIDVYEKAVAGYVEYLEKYMYFDKDGIIVESSEKKTPGIPQVTGLSFEHVVLYEPLPVEDPGVFESILSITQLVNKYNLSIDRIYFGKDKSITLYFDDIRVALGEAVELDEKIMKLQYMLPEIEGRSGELRMENYTEETKTVSFEPDDN